MSSLPKEEPGYYRPICAKCRKRVEDYMEEKGKYYCLVCRTPSERKAEARAKVTALDTEYKRQLAIRNRGYRRG